MKEIDFLPEWYKKSKGCHTPYKSQYAVLACIFIFLLALNWFLNSSLSSAQIDLEQVRKQTYEKQAAVEDAAKIQNRISEIEKYSRLTDEVDSKVNIANILAELSYLVDKKIVINKFAVSAEKASEEANSGSNTVRPAKDKDNKEPKAEYMRYKITIRGLASESTDVALFVCSLEDSDYFSQVYPDYTKSKQIKDNSALLENAWFAKKTATDAGDDYQVSEFEISCVLSNYKKYQNEVVLK